jgi:hypothetical protein
MNMSLIPKVGASDQPGTSAWESEGGSLMPNAATRLPEGIIAVTSTHYDVGPYSYSKLKDALAELARQSSK